MTEINSIPVLDGVHVLVVGSATCSPCKQLRSTLQNTEVPVECYYVDITQCADWATKYQVRSLPTTFVMKGDNVLNVIRGNTSDILEKINTAIAEAV